jgi:hypothetical protein
VGKNEQRSTACRISKATAVDAPKKGIEDHETFAQSSVTLYGIIDTGVGYQSSQTTLGSTSGGHSAVKMIMPPSSRPT